MSAGAACKLRIVRGSGYADWLRNYKILVNGAEVGIIARNSVLDVEVPCGMITVEARLDWGRSQPLTIEATPGSRLRSRCRTIGAPSSHSGAAHLDIGIICC
jgi:hypothetical protein